MPISTTFILRDFGATTSQPAYLSTPGNSLVNFASPGAIPYIDRNAAIGAFSQPLGSSGGTTSNAPANPAAQAGGNYQGLIQMPGQLLFMPGSGSTNGKTGLVINAAGTAVIPSTATGTPGFQIVMQQNYTTYGQSIISDTMFQMTAGAYSAAAGTTTSWSLTGSLGGGLSFPAISFAGAVTISGTKYVGNGYSVRVPAGQEPIIQLSIGLQFSGTAGANPFTGTLTLFNLTQTTQ